MSKSLFQISLLLLLLGGSSLPGDALSQSPRTREDVLQELKRVRTRLDAEERKLTELNRTEKKLRESVDKLRHDHERLDRQGAALREKLLQLEREISVAELQVAEVARRSSEHRSAFRTRLVSLYKAQHRASNVTYLAESGSIGELLRRTRYLGAVARSDKDRVDAIVLERAVLDQEQEQLSLKKADQSKKLDEVARLGQEIEAKKREQLALLREAEEKKGEGEKSLAKLTESAAQLERMLASLMGSEEPRPVPPDTTTLVTKGTVKSEQGGDREAVEVVTPFQGGGLAALEGKLALPVSGRLVQRFGKQRHEDFGDVLFVKGLEFASAVGAKVVSVAKGKVILSQGLPGFGNVVIVDHGSRYYTLYGRLASSLARPGDVVKAGDTIGVLGEVDHRGRNFYFELRFKGQAVDPRGYFRPGLLG